MRIVCLLLCALGCSAFSNLPSSFVSKSVTRAPNGGSNIQMKVEDSNGVDLSKAIQTAAISFSLLAGSVTLGPQDAVAAQSGGRVSGGSSFKSPRSSTPSSRPSTALNAAPAVVPVPVPVSPFGFSPFGGFGFSPFGFSPFGFGFGFGFRPFINPIDLLVVGVVGWGVLQLVRGVTGSGDWGSLDEESYSSLGEGVSVFKIQVAVNCANRGPNSLLADLQRISSYSDTSTRSGLSSVVQETALTLIRRSSEWEAAGSSFDYYAPRNADQAESAFNRIAVQERSKLERETFGNVEGRSIGGSQNERGIDKPTIAVVTIALALRGDTLKDFNSVSSMSGVKAALSTVAADVTTDGGENVLATELLWTPEDPEEVMLKQDMIADFPELIDL